MVNKSTKKMFKQNTCSKSSIKLKTVLTIVIVLLLILIIYNYIKSYEGFTNLTKKENQGLNKTDAVLYINLENREDRKKQILEELQKLSVPTNKIRKISGVHIPKNGHKGCIQSHILALQMAQMNNWKLTTIIEDDAELKITPTEFNNRLNNALEELNTRDWDVLLLSAINKQIDEETSKQLKHVDKLKHATTSTMYIIKQHYVNKLLKLFEHCNTMMIPEKWGETNGHEPYALDQKWNELIKKDNWYALKGDNVITQRASKSSINNRI
jgi:hypothetical protein